MSLLADPNPQRQEELEEQYESCLKYNISSHTAKKRGERELRLTIHFQKAQFPPKRMGKKPLFDYQIKQARLAVQLHDASMPITHVEPISVFPLHTELSIKKSLSGEFSSNASGKIDSTLSAEGSAAISHKHAHSLGEEFTQRKANIELIQDSDKELYWEFKSHDGDHILRGTLKEYLLGRLSECKTGAKATTVAQVFEKDIVADPPSNLTKLGLIGLVSFKYQKASIANEINSKSHQELSL